MTKEAIERKHEELSHSQTALQNTYAAVIAFINHYNTQNN